MPKIKFTQADIFSFTD